MIVSAPSDYRAAARRRLPPFLFHYIDGGAYAEHTLFHNVHDLGAVALRQRVLQGAGEIDLGVRLFGESLAMPVVLGPVGLTGMYARRGEVQAARAAARRGVPFTLSSVSVCPIAEVATAVSRPLWFQLYMLKDRGFMKHVLARARAAGVTTLLFTVDLPVSSARYRDAHSGLTGPHRMLRRGLQALIHPRWAWDVGIQGRPHDLGNVSDYLGRHIGLEDYVQWVGANFDPSVSWDDLGWIRDAWEGALVLKGILDAEDARRARHLGADGIVVSNHGGRQLDGVPSTARALPRIVAAVHGELTILADSGVRSGLDVVRLLALGADAVLLGRSYAYALAAAGEAGVARLLELYAAEMRVAMTLAGVSAVGAIDQRMLA